MRGLSRGRPVYRAHAVLQACGSRLVRPARVRRLGGRREWRSSEDVGDGDEKEKSHRPLECRVPQQG